MHYLDETQFFLPNLVYFHFFFPSIDPKDCNNIENLLFYFLHDDQSIKSSSFFPTVQTSLFWSWTICVIVLVLIGNEVTDSGFIQCIQCGFFVIEKIQISNECGTNFPNSYFIFNFSYKIWSICSLTMPMIFAIARPVKHGSSLIVLCTCSIIFGVLLGRVSSWTFVVS